MKRVLTPVLEHILAALVTFLTTGLLFIFRDLLTTPTVALVYLFPVLISTTIWGVSEGLVAGLISFLTLNFFFTVPYYTFHILHTQDFIALAIFFLVAVITSQLVGRARRNSEFAKARETEVTHLYDLSARLVGVNGSAEIAGILADQVLHTVQADTVMVEIFARPGQEACSAAAPEGRPPPLAGAAVIPIQTVRGLSGELHIWRAAPLEVSENRLLQTFATQGALALERAGLLQSETRARILEESDRLKSALLSSVSHELRTPLATIKAATTSLLSGEVDWAQTAARQELLDVVDEETDHLNHLVGNLLDMSRLEAGALKPDRQWNMLSEIVQDANERMHRVLGSHHLVSDIPEDLPLVPVDYYQLERVFTNLISNGAKYAPEQTAIVIHAEVRGDTVIRVQVTNQGPPVAPEDLPRIFDKFYRVTNADRITGTGLGLSICRGIIEAHGGRIWAENLPDGFAFNFELPLTWDGRLPPTIEAEVE
jgi:two-component system sensor histidine kinase KdpD